MTARTRKFFGSMILVGFVIVYALTAMVVGSRMLPEASPIAQLIYAAIAGLLWVIPAGAIIWWMGRPRGEN